MSHTPIPWKVAPDCADFDTLAVYANGIKIVFWGGHYNVPREEGEGNVYFIEKACNCHDELLAALRATLRVSPCGPHVKVAQAAIAKVEEWP